MYLAFSIWAFGSSSCDGSKLLIHICTGSSSLTLSGASVFCTRRNRTCASARFSVSHGSFPGPRVRVAAVVGVDEELVRHPHPRGSRLQRHAPRVELGLDALHRARRPAVVGARVDAQRREALGHRAEEPVLVEVPFVPSLGRGVVGHVVVHRGRVAEPAVRAHRAHPPVRRRRLGDAQGVIVRRVRRG